MKQRLISLILSVIITIGFMPSVYAQENSDPMFYITFETLESMRVENFAPGMCDIELNNVSANTNGYRGIGASIGSSGSITVGKGQLGSMLAGSDGFSFSAYIKAEKDSGSNLLTVHSFGETAGISLSLINNRVKLLAKTDSNETLKGADCNLSISPDVWTHILVSADFSTGVIKFYQNGEFKKSEQVTFMGNKFIFDGAAQNDVIGDEGISLDEVRIHNSALPCSGAASLMEEDSAEPEETAYKDILADNLVAGYSFNEGEGNITRPSGMVSGEATLSNTDWDEGVRGTALRFHPAMKSMVTIGNDVLKSLEGAPGFTVSGWIYVNDIPNVTYRIMSLNIEGTKAAMHLSYSKDTFQLATRSCPEDALQGRSYTWSEVGKWLFVTVTTDFKNQTVKFYVNGKELVSTQGTDKTSYSQSTFSCAEAQASTIGGDPTTPTYTMTFAGMLDEWKIYNRSITPDEAEYIYVDYKTVAPREKDAANYKILDKLSDNTAIMAVGMNEVIYKGKRNRINWDNINSCPVFSGDSVMMPVKLLTEVMGASVEWIDEGKSGTLSFESLKLEFDTNTGVYTVNGASKDGGTAPQLIGDELYLPLRFVFEESGRYVYYSDGLIAAGTRTEIESAFKAEGYDKWAKSALCDLPYTQPTANHAATRVQIARSDYEQTKHCYASPSIVKMSDGTLIAYHDAYVYGGASAGAFICRSEDGGATWKRIAEINTMMACIFELNGDLYVMGVYRGNSVVTLQKSSDGGYTWTQPVDTKTGFITNENVTQAHCGPTPVVIKDGRIYRAYESVIGAGFRNYCAFMLSADINSDLLDASSWTFTNTVRLLDVAPIPDDISAQGAGWLEGNAVIDPEGNVCNIIRVNFEPGYGYAAILKLSADNKTLTFDKFTKFDGGMTKFIVKRDEVTGKYISLVNNITHPDYSKQRVVLSLASSDGLDSWKLNETLLYPNKLENWENLILTQAFQYVDWIIDGDDILYIVREAADGALTYHDGLDITMYRIENFRQYLK